VNAAMPADLSSEHFSANPSEDEAPLFSARVNPFTAADVERILRARRWLDGQPSPQIAHWLSDAAALLGPQAAECSALTSEAMQALEDLLAFIFDYDAIGVLSNPENQSVMSREGARDVIRDLANRVLAGLEVDSARYKEIIEGMKATLAFHGRKLFHPIRLALAGCAGEGDLDRVILLLDAASRLSFAIPVKGTRQRMIEFCAALD
jgi:hypothetical protein